MGVYLSKPNTEKISIDESSQYFSCGASSMQGWRQTQEDAHNCILEFDTDPTTSLFAVYDGHGGSEVAQYCSMYFPDHLKRMQEYPSDHMNSTLQKAFMEFDDHLTQEETIKKLKVIAGLDNGDIADEEEAEKQEAALLVEEATMPLEDVLSKYPGIEWSGNADSTSLPSKDGQKSCIHKTDSCLPTEGPKDGSGDNKCNLCVETDKEISESSPTQSPNSLDSNSVNRIKRGDDQKENETPNLINETVDNVKEKSTDELKLASVCEDRDKCVADSSGTSEGTSEAPQPGPSTENSNSSNSRTLHSVIFENEDDDDEDYEEDDDKEDSDDEDDGEIKPDGEIDDDNMWEDVDDSDEDGGDEEEEDTDDTGFQTIPFKDIEDPGCESGCTALVALIRGAQLLVANVGDSRCVLCRQGRAVDLSIDHKPEDELERTRIENAGGKVTKDGRVNGGLNLSRAIGDHCYKLNKHLPPKDQMITAFPDVQVKTLTPDDSFIILACDGIWNVMSSQDAVDFVAEKLRANPSLHSKPSQICEELFDYCLAPDTSGDGTGCDNMTCIVIMLKDAYAHSHSANGVTEETSTKEFQTSDGGKTLSTTDCVAHVDGADKMNSGDESGGPECARTLCKRNSTHDDVHGDCEINADKRARKDA